MDIDIDIPSHKRDRVFDSLSAYYESIGGNITRVCTFGTETAKSTILTAARGLKINNDVGLYLSSLIPVERGKVWDIEDCYYGNEAKGRKPIADFVNTVDEYKDLKLLQVALGIQGLINKRSSHACGVIITNEPLENKNVLMRTPSGEKVTQFDLGDSEYVGNMKYDLLNTKTCAMIQVTLEMLVDNGLIGWQGSLRKTYNKYLHPSVIDRHSSELWELLNSGKLISAFQFDSNVGEQAIKLIKPTSLLEATNANNLMRLMADDKEKQPLELYVYYKEDINRWYKDMKKYGLTDKEIEIMKRHLLKDYGVCSTQEGMMLMTMDKEIAGFDVVESNIARKGVAKKIGDAYEKAHKMLFDKGRELGTSDKMLCYVWDEQIAMQRGYGFSLLHGIEYTYILIQQLNLIYYYPPIFWNTGVLLVESGALEQDATQNEDIEDLEKISSQQQKKKKEKTTNYGVIAKAIGNMQYQGVKIVLPDINRADLQFKPDLEKNEIIFGLKGVIKINNEISRLIMENRPFKKLDDFYKRMVLTKREYTTSTGKVQNKSLVSVAQTIMLIKAGAFDIIENKPRELILEDFLLKINPPKTNINGKSIEKIIEMGIVPPQFKNEVKLYRFRNYINKNKKQHDQTTASIKWHSLHSGREKVYEHALKMFEDYFMYDMEEGRDYTIDENGIMWIAMGTNRKGSFNYIYKEHMKPFEEWLKTSECLDYYNQIIFNNVKRETMWGNISSWEMESVNFYYHDHELANIDKAKYSISDFNELPEEPEIVGFTKYKGRNYPKFKLTRIVGTVLDRDKTRHSITVLTPTAVVQVKFYSGQFAFYDRQISVISEDEKGKESKSVLEESWFKRGNKILITGFRRGDQFKPKRYKNSIFPHSIQLITEVVDSDLILQSERVGVDAE